jgi:hypothetical protein
MPTVTVKHTPEELARVVEEAVAAIQALERGLGIKAPNLTASGKRRTARYRKGGAKMIVIIGNIARQNHLEAPLLPVSQMADSLSIAAALERLGDSVTILQARLATAVFCARADAWQTAMQYYALLQRVARRNSGVAAQLEPVKKFMSVHDPRPKRQPGEPSRTQVRAAKRAQKVLADQAEVAARKKKS